MRCYFCGNPKAEYARVFATVDVPRSIIWGLKTLTSKMIILCKSCKHNAHNITIPLEEYTQQRKRYFKLKKLLDK